MEQCRTCGEVVYPSGGFVYCEACNSEYQCVILDDYEEVAVSFAATQSQSQVLSQQEIIQQQTERLQAAKDAKSAHLIDVLRFAARSLSKIPGLRLPPDFEDKAVQFGQVVMSTMTRGDGSRLYSSNGSDCEVDSIYSLDDDGEDGGHVSGGSSRSDSSRRKNAIISADAITILWLVARLEMSKPCTFLISDLIRWTKELHIYIPKSDRNTRSNYQVKSECMRLARIFTSQCVKVERVHPPDVKAITKRVCQDLELPLSVGKAVWAFYRKQYGIPVDEVVPNRRPRNKPAKSYDLDIAVSFVAVLKLFFGLNGQCERKLDFVANELNQKFGTEKKWEELFLIEEWLQYIQWRSAMLRSVHYPSLMRHGMNLVAYDMSPQFHYQKLLEKRSCEFQGTVFDEDQYWKPEQTFGPQFEFSASLSAFAAKDREFRIRYASLNERDRKKLDINTMPSPPDFRSKSVRHTLEQDRFVEDMTKRGIQIRKCPSFTGKLSFSRSLRDEEFQLSRFGELAKSKTFFYEDPGKVSCEINTSDTNLDDEQNGQKVYNLPVPHEPLLMFETPRQGHTSVNVDEWTRNIRSVLPHSLAVVVEVVADLFQLTELELLSEVSRLEKEYSPNQVLRLER